MNKDIKKTLTKAVLSEINASKSSKSRGTKIATSGRVIPIITIEPFSQ